MSARLEQAFDERGAGTFSKPGSLGAWFNDVNPWINWLEYAIAILWWGARVAYRGDVGARIIGLRFNADFSPDECMAELRRLHVDYTPLCCTNHAVYIAVGSKQAQWADYVLVRFLEGEPVPAWRERRPGGPGGRPERRRPGRRGRPQRRPQGGRP